MKIFLHMCVCGGVKKEKGCPRSSIEVKYFELHAKSPYVMHDDDSSAEKRVFLNCNEMLPFIAFNFILQKASDNFFALLKLHTHMWFT